VLPFFQWCEATQIGHAIRDSSWLFPVIEALHLLGFAALGGTVLLVDLRLLGLGLRREPVRSLAQSMKPWLYLALAVMLTSGALLFLSEPVKCYGSAAFWVKMWSLLFALLFTFTIRRIVVSRPDTGARLLYQDRIVAVVSLLLWAGVAGGGRWIGFS